MRLPFAGAFCKAASLAAVALCLAPAPAQADWRRGGTTLSWMDGTNAVWTFSFDPKFGKPFFNPVCAPGGRAVTLFRPQDHPWHYGLWFSWKYINGVNYWEEDRTSGKAEGATTWAYPQMDLRPDGGAAIHLDVIYATRDGRVDMSEARELHVSAPKRDGSYSIDWRGQFTAGEKGALLDRTPLLGEPNGKVNGGYGGLGLRMVNAPLTMSVFTTTRAITNFISDRARPRAPAVGCNFADGDRLLGGIAVWIDPAAAGRDAPWYIINSATMRFVCPAILAPKPIQLAPGEKMAVHFRIFVSAKAWTPESLGELK